MSISLLIIHGWITDADQLRQRVKAAVSAGQSLNDIAQKSGIKQPTLHRFSNGGNPTAALLDKLAEYFELGLGPAVASKRKKAKD